MKMANHQQLKTENACCLTDKHLKMKNISLLFLIFFLIISCNNTIIKKPENLIERDQMVDIIYDLSILEGMKSTNSAGNEYPTATQFLKKKYKIDSLTYSKNSHYYSSDLIEYKKMFDEVKQRLEENNAKINPVKKGVILKETPSLN